MNLKIKPIAIYLPQFHPFRENDKWWGKGFTEWTNVTKAKPLFSGHKQPNLPTELGYYDLRLEESRMAQIALARENGIYGFCYYHYWFNGKRLMQEPVDRMLNNPKENFPFMFCWANESWSRRWLGEEKDVLIKQTYSNDDNVKHITWLCENVFSDSRYIKINNRPVFIFYRPHDLPDHMKIVETFKNVAIQLGTAEPYLVASNSHTQDLNGFDHILNFEPQLSLLDDAFNDQSSIKRFFRNRKQGITSASLKIYDYTDVKKKMAARRFDYLYFPCVFVGWDNTARRGDKGIIIKNQNKHDFKESLLKAKEIVLNYPEGERLIFINAWNEWAEGNYLEPGIFNGSEFLHAVKEVFR